MVAMAPAAFSGIVIDNSVNITLAASQFGTSLNAEQIPDVTGGIAGALIPFTETGTNLYNAPGVGGRAGANGIHNLNDGDIGTAVPTDGSFAIPNHGSDAVVMSLTGGTQTVTSIAIYHGYGNRDVAEFVLKDGVGNTLGEWHSTGTNITNAYWITFPTPVTTDRLIIETSLPGSITPSFREIQVFHRTEGTIYVDRIASGQNNGTSWAHAFTSLQDALAISTSGDEIHVAEGTYYPDEGAVQTDNDRNSNFFIRSSICIEGGFPAGGGVLAQRDPAVHSTILSGDLAKNDTPNPASRSDNAYHVVIVENNSFNFSLDGFTVTSGNADGSSPHDSGGGLFTEDGITATITSCSFHENRADRSGGAVYIPSSSSNLNFDDSFFRGNTAISGGAIYINSSSPGFTNCAFQGNKADSRGGAIYNNTSSPTFKNCSFQGNLASVNGGAIRNFRSSDPTLANCIFWSNKEGSFTTTTGASIANSSSTPAYSHCIVANSGGSAGWNSVLGSDNGNNLDVNPLFLLEVAPAAAPDAGGNLRLSTNSPAINVGDNDANPSSTDLDGNPRKVGTIDLGAFEQQGIAYVDPSASAPNNGTSWDNAYTTLQDALINAASGQEIRVATGTFYPDEGPGQSNNLRSSTFQLRSGVAILGGYPSGGGLRDPATNVTTLSGDLDKNDGPHFANTSGNAYHVVTGTGTDGSAFLDGFTIIAGNGRDDGNGGGGLLCNPGSPALANCNFLNNQAIFGGAISTENASTPTFTNCSFRGNRGVFGGAIHNKNNSSPSITNCLFQGNKANNAAGAVLNTNFSSPTITNCSFQGNQATTLGGAIYNNTSSAPALSNCILWNNEEDGSTATPGASITSNGFSIPTYSHCLAQNLDPIGTANLDGTNRATNPLFLLEINPALAPSTNGDLRLITGSPAVDAGANGDNPSSTDLAGNPRIQNSIIDLGALEGTIIDPTLLWNTDADLDGNPWGVEHSLGTDPNSPDRNNPANLNGPSFDGGDHPTFTFGRNPRRRLPHHLGPHTLPNHDRCNFHRDFSASTAPRPRPSITSASPPSSAPPPSPSPTPLRPPESPYYRFEAKFSP